MGNIFSGNYILQYIFQHQVKIISFFSSLRKLSPQNPVPRGKKSSSVVLSKSALSTGLSISVEGFEKSSRAAENTKTDGICVPRERPGILSSLLHSVHRISLVLVIAHHLISLPSSIDFFCSSSVTLKMTLPSGVVLECDKIKIAPLLLRKEKWLLPKRKFLFSEI